MSVDHYENFPVASVLMPAHLKPAVIGIYAFARTADDIADEGNDAAEQRLASLKAYEDELDKVRRDIVSEMPLFQNLRTIIRQHVLPISPFYALLSAFKQDVITTRYQNFADLLDYCNRSANPVGEIMLHLYRAASPENIRDSDAICSALQLINFWQDVAIDWQKQRIYLPQEDLLAFGIEEQQIADGRADLAWQKLMLFQTDRARRMLISGSPLCKRLPGRIGWELRFVVQGGLRILERLDQIKGDVFTKRPKLGKFDWLVILGRGIRM
jgi:squalene synthase HpnC